MRTGAYAMLRHALKEHGLQHRGPTVPKLNSSSLSNGQGWQPLERSWGIWRYCLYLSLLHPPENWNQPQQLPHQPPPAKAFLLPSGLLSSCPCAEDPGGIPLPETSSSTPPACAEGAFGLHTNYALPAASSFNVFCPGHQLVAQGRAQ